MLSYAIIGGYNPSTYSILASRFKKKERVKAIKTDLNQAQQEALEQIYLHKEPRRELKLQALRVGDLGITARPEGTGPQSPPAGGGPQAPTAATGPRQDAPEAGRQAAPPPGMVR